MSSDARDKFITETYTLSRTPYWREFVSAFSAYVQEQIEQAIQAPPEQAAVQNGKVQSLVALRDDFRKIETSYQAVRDKQLRKPAAG